MVIRSLSALDYPEVGRLNVNDENQLRKVIAWIDEKWTRKCNPLRNINSADWIKHFETYKTQLGCPTFQTRLEELQWLIGYVVQQEYSKKKDVYNKHAVENIESERVPNVVAENPLDKLDFRSKEFADGINALAKILKITPHPDPLITLKAASKVVTKRLNQHALDNPNEYIIKGTPFPFQDHELGFDLNDPVLNQAAKILQMLYIHNLRDLQTKANELIVAVQTVTANPKTDTKLGKVGR